MTFTIMNINNNNNINVLLMVALVMVCGLWEVVDAHGKMLYPVPRAGSGARLPIPTKIAKFPVPADYANSCGGADNKDPGPLAIQATVQAGSSISVAWQTVIYHPSAPGVRISIRYQDTDDFSDPQNILADGLDIGSGDGTACHNATVILDGRTSDTAVLQWMWASQSDGGFYISCADIKVQAGPVDGNAVNNYDLYDGQCLGVTPSPTKSSDDPSKPSQNNSGESSKKEGMSAGGKAALSIFLIALFGTVAVAGFLYYKNGNLFGYQVSKGGIVKASGNTPKGVSAETNYMAFNDDQNSA